jgi:hypothetical protein
MYSTTRGCSYCTPGHVHATRTPGTSLVLSSRLRRSPYSTVFVQPPRFGGWWISQRDCCRHAPETWTQSGCLLSRPLTQSRSLCPMPVSPWYHRRPEPCRRPASLQPRSPQIHDICEHPQPSLASDVHRLTRKRCKGPSQVFLRG